MPAELRHGQPAAPLHGRAEGWNLEQANVRLVRTSLPLDASAPAMASSALGSLSKVLPADLLSRAQHLLAELLSQRLRYAMTTAEDALRLDVALTPERLGVRLTDFDGLHMVAPALHWDLRLIAELADRWGVRQEGASMIWFELER